MSESRSSLPDGRPQPTVSVVVPVLNEVRLRRALDSVLAQTYRPAPQLIVVDGGSTDGTVDVLAEYGDRISLLLQGSDGGIFDAINKGTQRATGNVVAFLGADDRYADSRILEDVMPFFEDRALEACYGDVVFVDEGDQVVRYWQTQEHSRFKLYCGWQPPHSATFIRKEVFDRYGYFATRYPRAADYEFFLRVMLKHQINAKYVPRTIAKLAPGGASSAFVRSNIEVLPMPWRLGLYGAFLVPFLKPARKLSQLWKTLGANGRRPTSSRPLEPMRGAMGQSPDVPSSRNHSGSTETAA